MARPVNPERKDEVLEGVVAFLAEHGLPGLSMRRLADSLGVSTNVLSYQFGSKEGVVEAALVRARASSTEMLERLRADDPSITVADATRRMWAWWSERPERFAYPRLNMEAMMTSDPASLEQSRRPDLIAFWIEYFVDWFVSEGRTPEEGRELSALLNATLTGLVVDLICTGESERVTRTLERFIRTIEPVRVAK